MSQQPPSKTPPSTGKDCGPGPAGQVPAPACGSIPLARPRYFSGRFLTERDFSDEQNYHRGRRHLHNRLLHGWGVICGLDLTSHPNPACQAGHVVLGSGVALDCCGREIVVTKSRALPLPPPEEYRQNDGRRLFLCLRYEECPAEKVPILNARGVCTASATDYSQTYEGYGWEWVWLEQSELPGYGWRQPLATGHDAKQPGDGGCIEPACPGRHCLLIAEITGQPGHPVTAAGIDSRWRRVLPPPASYLTHIVHTNWVHGRRLSLSQLRAQQGRLVITFDRELREQEPYDPYCPSPSGVSPATFQVRYGPPSGGQRPVPYPHAYPPWVYQEWPCRAVYQIDPHGTNHFADLVGHVIHIELRCDFVVDKRGLAVDGDHLRGILPSGDGREGGAFHSWFFLAADEPCPPTSQPTQEAAV